MKVLILHPHSRYDRYLPDIPAAGRMELVFTDREGPEERWLAAGGDADALVAAPVTPVTAELIARMPNLKLIHSDGIGVDRIDVEAARRRGIYVCNCAGCNAGPVAELAVTLMSMLLHRTLWGDRMVRSGRQHEAVNILAADCVLVILERSFLAFSAISFNRCIAILSLVRSTPFSFLNSLTR